MKTALLESESPSSAAGSQQGSLVDYWLYLQRFFRCGLDVASVAPSSRWTARALTHDLRGERNKTIVELGAGTGAVTAELLRATRGQSRCLIVERDPHFCSRLRQRFPDAEIIEGDALDLEDFLREHQAPRIDHVLCTLPLNWLPAAERHRLLDVIRRRLHPQGTFRQLTHLPLLHRAWYARYFAQVKARVVLRNLPPAGCYFCRQPRLD